MEDNIIKHCLEAVAKLEEAFVQVDAAKINTVPFEGSWTAAQVADHILKSLEGLGRMVAHGRTAPTARNPAEQVEGIRAVFLDSDTKMKSPDFVLPSEKPMERDVLLNRLKQVRAFLLTDMAGLDLSLTCTDFSLPGNGMMTRLEWMNFFEAHAIRHTRQMQRIAKGLT